MLFRRFLQDRRGGVAPMLGLAIIPIIGLMGAAVDYSRANAARTSMQAAADTTALMLSLEVNGLSDQALGEKAIQYFTAVFNQPQVQNLQVTPTLQAPQQGNFSLTLNSSGTIKTVFVGAARSVADKCFRELGSRVGHEEAQSRACARQYRIDGVKRQVGRAQRSGA